MPKKSSDRKPLTRREAHDLDVEIGFIEGVVRRDPESVDALQILGDDYTRRGRLIEGLRVDERLCRLRPDDAFAHYNLACSCSLTRQPERAITALARALDLGYRDVRWLRRDPDLKNIRRHPRYREIRERLRAMALHAR